MRPTILPDAALRLVPKAIRATMGKAGVTASEARAGAVAKSERELQGQLCQLLRLKGVQFIVNQRFGVKTTAPKGTPDILFCLHGSAQAWEVKLPGEKPRPEQVKAMAEMTADGWRCAVVTSVDQALQILNELTPRGSNP